MYEIKRAKRLSQPPVYFHWSNKFVHWPKNVRSTNSCQVQAFQDNLWAYFGYISDCFWLLLLEVVIIQARGWNFVQLLSSCSPIRNISQNQLFQQKFVIRTFSYIVQQLFLLVCIHVGYTPSIRGQEMMSVLQDHCSSISSTWETCSASFQPISSTNTK